MLLRQERLWSSLIKRLGGDKMELRSRGAVKVVWRSSEHLRYSPAKAGGKA